MRVVDPHAEAPDFTPRLVQRPDPRPGPGEAVLEVRATALNHADLLQLRGKYPPPPGETDVPGLEAAGVIAEMGEGVADWRRGRRAMALLAGGGHGTRVVVPVGQLMPVPERMSFTEAAAIPEAALTAWTNLVAEGELRAGEWVVITGATGGVGRFALQLAKELGGRVLAAGRDIERLEPLRDLGARDLVALGESFPEAVRRTTDGHGADLILDLVGGEHTARGLEALADRGRLVLLGLLAGGRAEIDLAAVLRRRLRLVGSVLRARPREEKARLVADFRAFADERLEDGRLRSRVQRVYAFDEVAQAYAALAAGAGSGKIVVEMAGAS